MLRYLNPLLQLLRCVRLGTCTRRGRSRLPLWMRELWAYMRLLVQSLYFNSLTDSDVIFDSIFEPVLFTVEHVTRSFGRVFVCVCVALTSSITVIAYVVLLPIVLTTYTPIWIAWHLTFGHWIIVMITFHYYKAIKTSPGFVPFEKYEGPVVAVCKKCVMPKPARTHHCGICNRCVLKMDHHCPWMNGCVGHYNHRYFFSFCLFMTLGCVYCVISGRNLFLDSYKALETSNETPTPTYSFKDKFRPRCIVYMWVLTSTITIVLGALTCWHAVLITKGETSIERHINSKEAERMANKGKVYKNPHNYGRLNNWKLFLGVEKRSHWVTRVLLPSRHTPRNNGLTWNIFPLKKDVIPV
ncbi:palmitoyltransferase ZDHHC16A isoform X2 [Antennarius striatus]|uniref:palmitoyltransferase ZDHHC16A isoform X2 n=1 Tax=Antennarius striatus TaxID=241820 RepID=UPI0035B4BEC1